MSASSGSISSFVLDPSASDSDGASACSDGCHLDTKQSYFDEPSKAYSSDGACEASCDHCHQASQDFEVVEDDDFHDVLVVGAGPNGLALVSRLRERHPPSIYTDLEQARIRWLGGKLHTKVKGQRRKLVGRESSRAPETTPKICVFDASGSDWMQTWRNYFQNLNIRHLRSPMFFNPSPHIDSLVAFAQEQGRENELREVPVVGKAVKHKKNPKVNQVKDLVNERDRQDYFCPSRGLFNDYIQHELVDRFQCQELVQQGRATNIQWLDGTLHVRGSGLQSGFRVTVQTGSAAPPRQIAAKAVVLAMGPAGTPNIPDFLPPYKGRFNEGPGWCHSSTFSQLPEQFAFACPPSQTPSRKLLIIGGGLTSAQISELGLTKGFTHVTLLCRSKFKTKYFDVDLEWVSKYGNLHKMKFFQEECFHQRLKYVQEARNGGSVTPQYNRICKDLCKRGLLDIREQASIIQASYQESEGWEVQIGPNKEAPVEHFDYIVAATGFKLDIERVSALDSIRKSHPIDIVGGLPCLTEDLAWREDLPLFMMGGYSQLQAGPAAYNLVATRESAERIVHGLSSRGLLGKGDTEESEREKVKIHGGFYSCLENESD